MRQRKSLGRLFGVALLAPAFTGLVAFATTSISACGVGDQYCPDDTLDTDLGDDCPYGPPGGPQEPIASCPTIPFLEADDPTCEDADFNAVVAVFDGAGSCSIAACHGTPQAAAVAKGVELTPGNASQMYTELSEYLNASGEPYLGEDVPRSWILCNLKAQVGGGSPMPTTGFPPLTETPDDLSVIEKWVRCGMKPPKPGGGASSSASSSSGEGGSGAGGEGTGGAGEGGGTGGAGEGGGTGGDG